MRINKKKRNFLNFYEDEKINIKENVQSYEEENRIKKSKKYKSFNKSKIKNKSFLFINIFIFIIVTIETFIIIKNLFSSSKQLNKIFLNYNNTIDSLEFKENYTNTKKEEIININKKNFTNIKKEENINIGKKNYKSMTKDEAISIGKKYVEMCKQGLLFNTEKIKNNKEPIISVIVPVYNTEKFIKSTIRTIQNQNMTDIEIILINDCPSDNSTNIIKEMQKEDPRIKIIYNNKTMGTLYSRNIGVLEAKGKYITCIDNDDLFIDKYLFDILYEETNDEYFDILSFSAFKTDLKFNKFEIKPFTYKEESFTLYQPELSFFSINKNDPLYDMNVLIWGLLIKTGIYKGAVNLLGKERYSNCIVWAEDTTMFFIICNLAQSYKFVKKFGIFHYEYKSSSEILSIDSKFFSHIFMVDVLFDYSKNEYKTQSLLKLMEIQKREYNFPNKISNKTKEYLKIVFKKIINCDYISETNKNELKICLKDYNLFN